MNDILLPLILPLVFAIIVGVMPPNNLRKKIALAGFILHFLVSCILLWTCRHGEIKVAIVGEWLAPFGIVLFADLFALFFLFAVSLTFLATYLYGMEEFNSAKHPFELSLIFILQAGLSLSLLTADFFNLFVSFEVMLAASYALVALKIAGNNLKWALSYLLINLIGTLGFLTAAAMIYGYTGHLNLAVLAHLLEEQDKDPFIYGWGYFLLGIFGLKAAIFPLFFWLPKTYSNLPAALAALFAGSLTKIGVYVLIRLFVVLLPGSFINLHGVLIVISILTMLLGVLGAIASSTIRGILSYHIISQVGYMILGLALYTPLAVTSALLLIIHNIWVKASLFLIGGVAEHACHSDDLRKMGNLSLSMPWLAAGFLIQALSLAGFPPLSGFWGKYLLVSESLRLDHNIAAAAALMTGWLTLFSMIKIWIGAFWQDLNQKSLAIKFMELKGKTGSIVMLVCASLLLGFAIEPIYQKAHLAIEQIFKKETYIQSILKQAGKGVL